MALAFIPTADPAALKFRDELIKRGWPMSKVHREVIRRLGDDSPTEQTIANYHKRLPPLPNLLLVCALADIYEIEASSLSPAIAERLSPIRELLLKSRCFLPACTSDAMPPAMSAAG